MSVDLAPATSLFRPAAWLWRLLLAGCADTRGGPIPYDRPLAAPDAPTVQSLATDYKIAPMDKLTSRSSSAEDLSGDYDVDLAGQHFACRWSAKSRPSNLTTAELDQQLTAKLGEKYLEHPDVSVGDQEVDGARR